MKRILFCLVLIIASFSLHAVDWTASNRNWSGNIPQYETPVTFVIPREAAKSADLASTEFSYGNDVSSINFDEGDFQSEDQIAVASVQGLRYEDIVSGTSVTIQVDCPQGFEFISESNPAYRRPFSIVVAVSYARVAHNGATATYYTISEHRGARLSHTGQPFTIDVSQSKLPSSYSGQEFWIVFDILLELQGTVSNGILTMPDGTTYSLANLNDYTASVSVSVSYNSNNTTASHPNTSNSLIIPFSGYYDSRGAGGGGNVSSLAVNPTPRSSTIRIDEEQGQPVTVATMDFLRLLNATGRWNTDPSPFDIADTRIFLSSSSNPEINGGEFRFVHDSVKPGDILDDRNSIRYEVRAVDSENGNIVVFDGTMTRGDMELYPKESAGDYMIIPRNISSASHPDYGRDVAYWQEYNGSLEVVLERKFNTMYAGAYKSYVYVHVYTEGDV